MDTTSSSSIVNNSHDYSLVLIATIVSLLLILVSVCLSYFCLSSLNFDNVNMEELNCFQKYVVKICNKLCPRSRTYEADIFWENINQIHPVVMPVRKVLVEHFESENLDSELECSICLEKIGDLKCNIGCDHAFHEECIKTWIINNNKTTCPICRNSISVLVV